MNFNYSYRAFLITSLLVGNLVLLLVTAKLNKKVEAEEEVMPVAYSDELLEEEEIAISTENVKIQTNTAYNEAEQFIRELEDGRNTTTPLADAPSEEVTAELDVTTNDLALSEAQKQLKKVKEKLSQQEEAKREKEQHKGNSVNRKTTISYHLKDRKSMQLPNPVYICDSGGKVVINIQVNALGKVVKATYNKLASTTTNGCLIDSAIEYATKARFNTNAASTKQIGTISYSFPGQY